MAILPLVYAPNPIFRQKAAPVSEVNDDIRQLADDMLETMYDMRGIGMGANMVGVLKRIIVVDIQEEGVKKPLVCLNPEITWASDETSTNEEASLCFPGVSADISRPSSIKMTYMGLDGETHDLEASDWLATVLQHEVDYLNGKTYLDHLSKMKRDRLLKKSIKYQKHAHSHACHDPHCGHDH